MNFEELEEEEKKNEQKEKRRDKSVYYLDLVGCKWDRNSNMCA